MKLHDPNYSKRQILTIDPIVKGEALKQVGSIMRSLSNEDFWGDVTVKFQNGLPVVVDEKKTTKLQQS